MFIDYQRLLVGLVGFLSVLTTIVAEAAGARVVTRSKCHNLNEYMIKLWVTGAICLSSRLFSHMVDMARM